MLNKSHRGSCYGCSLFDGRNSCDWFEPKKLIPKDILFKGCKFYDQKFKNVKTNKTIQYLIEVFEGEFI